MTGTGTAPSVWWSRRGRKGPRRGVFWRELVKLIWVYGMRIPLSCFPSENVTDGIHVSSEMLFSVHTGRSDPEHSSLVFRSHLGTTLALDQCQIHTAFLSFGLARNMSIDEERPEVVFEMGHYYELWCSWQHTASIKASFHHRSNRSKILISTLYTSKHQFLSLIFRFSNHQPTCASPSSLPLPPSALWPRPR
jgi:hypothetical protein